MIITQSKMLSYLSGAAYPTTKVNVIDWAENNGAPDEVLYALDDIPDREYSDHLAVMGEITDDEPADEEESKEGSEPAWF